jgi:hypothetical protein
MASFSLLLPFISRSAVELGPVALPRPSSFLWLDGWQEAGFITKLGFPKDEKCTVLTRSAGGTTLI